MLLTSAAIETGLLVAKAIAEIHLATITALPETERAEYARMVLDDMKAWRALVAPLRDLLINAHG